MVRSTSGYAQRNCRVAWRNVWILEDVESNISKAFNIPIIVDKIFIHHWNRMKWERWDDQNNHIRIVTLCFGDKGWIQMNTKI